MTIPDDKLKQFIIDQGGEILPQTNEWEVIRFRSKEGIGVVYTNKHGRRTYTGEAVHALKACYKKDATWNLEKKKRKNMSDVVERLIRRDGIKCFYCGNSTNSANRTVEHLLSLSDGGNHRMANLAIACDECNFRARSSSLVEKVRLRDKLNKNLPQTAPDRFVPNPHKEMRQSWLTLKIRALKHHLGLCHKVSLGYRCYGSNNYNECGGKK